MGKQYKKIFLYQAGNVFFSAVKLGVFTCGVYGTQVLQTAVWRMGRGDTWGGATRVAPPTPNSIGLYGKSYWCRPEHVHSFVYDFVKLIWPYYRNIMC